jgi:hypothetical protein
MFVVLLEGFWVKEMVKQFSIAHVATSFAEEKCGKNGEKASL